jgi:hypothetical protein
MPEKSVLFFHSKRSLLTILVFVSVVLTGNLIFAQTGTVTFHSDEGSAYENKVIRLNHLEAHITPDTLTETVKGIAIFDFSPLRPDFDSIVLFAPGIRPEQIRINDNRASFSLSGNNLIIKGSSRPFS